MRARPRPHNPMPESRYEVLALFTGAMVGASLLLMSTGTLLTFIEKTLHLSQTQLGLVLSVQVAGSLLMTAAAGMLTDRFGDKRVVFWSGLFMGTSLLLAAAVQNFTWLLVWLLMYGLGYAAVTPSGSHAIIFFFKKEERGLAMGIRQCGIPLAGVVGSLVLPAIALRFDYQWALVGAAVATIFACSLAALLYREPSELEGERVSVRAMFAEMLAIARDIRLAFMTITSMALASAQFAVIAFFCLTLVHEARYGLSEAITLFTVSQVAAIAGRISWGWASDVIFRGHRALTLAAACVTTALATFGFSLVTPGAAFVTDAGLAVAIGFFAEGWFGVAVLAFAEIGGEEHSGSALGVAVTWIFLAAVIAPVVFGAVAQTYGYPLAWRALALLAFAGIAPALMASVFVQKFVETAKGT